MGEYEYIDVFARHYPYFTSLFCCNLQLLRVIQQRVADFVADSVYRDKSISQQAGKHTEVNNFVHLQSLVAAGRKPSTKPEKPNLSDSEIMRTILYSGGLLVHFVFLF